jgi:hypothetical protein
MTVFCTFGSGGIILEFEAGLEATGKKPVCENSASKGVIEKNWGPSSSTTLRGIGRDVGKYLVKMIELAGAVFKKLPEPVLQDRCRRLAVSRQPSLTHCSLLLFLLSGEILFPFKNRGAKNPRLYPVQNAW